MFIYRLRLPTRLMDYPGRIPFISLVWEFIRAYLLEVLEVVHDYDPNYHNCEWGYYDTELNSWFEL